MKLTIVFPVLGQHELATVAIQHALDNIVDPNTRIVVIDNGGDYFDKQYIVDGRLTLHTPRKNLGVYPVFDYAMKIDLVTGDVVAFFHSDLIVTEKGFDVRILQYFEGMPELGLIGFVGSNEIDIHGGRGGGTTSNFQGKQYDKPGEFRAEWWNGSPAEAHGMRNEGFTNAAVVDGCAMVIRRAAWEKIGYRSDFPPHHFYDRLISTQMLENHYKVGVLGIACDHISGQTVSQESRYGEMGHEWLRNNDAKFIGGYNVDRMIYQKAESMWLNEYRNLKHIVPIKV